MPDDLPRKGPAAKGPNYDDDFYAWTQHQATVLREMAVADNRFDREHVAEEIEDLGKAELNAIRSQVRRIIEHLLKLEHSPARDPRYGWMGSITDARQEIADKITRTLRPEIEGDLSRLFRDGRKRASITMTGQGEAEAAARLPNACPYTFEQILEEDWYPNPPEAR
jgi:Domain of unknown function DUF29